jgi:hypothetical protein
MTQEERGKILVEDLNELFKDVLEYSNVLFETVNKVGNYIKTKYLSP